MLLFAAICKFCCRLRRLGLQCRPAKGYLKFSGSLCTHSSG
ncbi:hypothetical protein EIKCOROL_01716 [Eikenella corrodens ATCC 23834]|uniref:Uncharacterized protein n=1 Tax=Eikenella corrodens ATCC 23834 TaxID=546274 RepID=C0DWG5_EIKCO|nr:hypothetical protein EIKCOROL_01716 [Eikenella corrodens ATCC 23834]